MRLNLLKKYLKLQEWMPAATILLIAGLLLLLKTQFPVAPAAPASTSSMEAPAALHPRQRVTQVLRGLPVSFEENRGQTAANVRFFSRTRDYTLFLTPEEAVLALWPSQRRATSEITSEARSGANLDTAVVRMRFDGAQPDPQIEGVEELAQRSNYFRGRDPALWTTDVRHFQRIRYRSLYPGVDLVYYHTDDQELEYDFLLAPGADPSRIRMKFTGTNQLSLDGQGNLQINMGQGELTVGAPSIFQELAAGEREVAGGFVLLDSYTVGFKVASYDREKPLRIDPALTYSSYLGGTNVDVGTGIAIDSSGNMYVTGYTSSSDFPVAGSLQAISASPDALVTKINAQGTALVYSTYLGGNGRDEALGIAVDSSGNAFITGYTLSTNFPISNAFQNANKGGRGDAFIARLNSTGSGLIFSSYLGGSGSAQFLFTAGDRGEAIALDPAGNAYITGQTDSSDFPTRNPFQSASGGQKDYFVAKFTPAGSLVYSTYFGGNRDELGKGESFSGGGGGVAIAVDSSGNALIAGTTLSPNIPQVKPLQNFQGTQFSGDLIIAKLNAAGSALLFSSYYGGNNADISKAIALDPAGNIYVTGWTWSNLNFPTVKPFLPSVPFGYIGDAFVTKIHGTQLAVIYSTYLGGPGNGTVFGGGTDIGFGIAADAVGNAYVAGTTNSARFPLVSPLQAAYAGPAITTPDTTNSGDVFITRFNAAGAAVFSTYLGGKGNDQLGGIAADASGNVYLAGSTHSTDFPTVKPFQSASKGGSADPRSPGVELMVAKLSTTPSPGEMLPPVPSLPWTRFIRVDTNFNGIPDEQDQAANILRSTSGQNVLLTFVSSSLGVSTVEFSNPHPQTGRYRTMSHRRQRTGRKGKTTTRTTTVTVDQFDAELRPIGATVRHEAVKTATTVTDATVTLLDEDGDGIRETIRGQITGKPSIKADILYVDINGDRKADFISGPWPLSVFIGVLTGTPQVFIPLGDSNGDAIPDSPVFDLDANNLADTSLPVAPPVAGPAITTEQKFYFAHFGDGAVPWADIFSQVLLMNLVSGAQSEVKLNLSDDSGAPLTVDLNGELVAGLKELLIPGNGLGILKTDGQGPLTSGGISVTSNRQASGVILFGGSVGLAGVGASQAFPYGFIAPMETNTSQQINTGIAILNLENRETTAELELAGTDGVKVAGTKLEGETALKPLGRVVKFLSEFNWIPPVNFADFMGVLRVRPNGKVTATVLQTRPGEFATFPVTTLPLETTPQGFVNIRNQISFAHFGDGAVGAAQIFSQIMLLNPDPNQTANVALVLLSDSGTGLKVDLNGQEVQNFTIFTIPPGGLRILKTDGQGPLISGSAIAYSNKKLAGVLLFGGSVGVAGVGGSGPISNGFLAPMETNSSEQVNTGVAVQNLETVTVPLELQLLDLEGKVVSNAKLQGAGALAPFGHIAKFVNEFPWDPPVDFSNFVGLLKVTSSGRVTATVLQVRPGRFATMPVAPL
ncbi:MAG: SBBP repeat-containing protein [Acidobacteria bacterium]|nr:SBBP repeat-containing protein [Acidobacteriota bacterium]